MSSSRDRIRLRLGARAGVVVAGALLAVLASAQPAAAHAVLVGSDPANGTALSHAPRAVTLRFSEGISPKRSTARLVDVTGRSVGDTRADVGSALARTLTLRLPPLRTGTYGVVWTAFTEWDAHTTTGVVVFSVGATTGASELALTGDGPDGGPFDVLLNWLGLCLLAGLIGGLVVAGPVLGRVAPPQDDDGPTAASSSIRRTLLAFSAACAAAGMLVGLLTWRDWSYQALATELTFAALVVVCLRLRSLGTSASGGVNRAVRKPRTWALWTVALMLVAAMAYLEALSVPATGKALVAARALHVLTACLWLGPVSAVALALLMNRPPLASTRAGRAALVRACRAQLTRPAVLSVATLAATGVLLAGRRLESVDALVTTFYGRATLAEMVLMAGVCGLGWANAARMIGRAPAWLWRAPAGRRPSMRPSRLLAVEAVLGALLLFVVGLLAQAPPASAPPPDTAPDATQTLTGSAADLVVSVAVTPNRPGVNGFAVLAASTRRPAPMPIDELTLEIALDGLPLNLSLQQVEPGRYFGVANLRTAGPMHMAVVLHRAGSLHRVPLDWSVASAVTPSSVGSGSLAPITDQVAMILFGAGVLIGLWWLVNARPRGQIRVAETAELRSDEKRVLEGFP